MPLDEHFVRARTAGLRDSAAKKDIQQLVQKLNKLDISAGIVGCLDLACSDREGFETAAHKITNDQSNTRAKFVMRLAKEGAMPLGRFDLSQIEYHFARVIILLLRSEARMSRYINRWPDAQSTARTRPFYPEYLSLDRRERIATIARDHAKLGPGSPKQAVLFSLGGYYTYGAANRTPNDAGTTCLLFFRSILHAAGCNTAENIDENKCYVPSGTANLPDKLQRSYVGFDQWSKGVRPKKGDVFHIRGKNYGADKNNDGIPDNDSSHWGIITDTIASTTWETVEGGKGTGGEFTLRSTRNLVTSNGNKNELVFADDTHVVGERPLRGWYDPIPSGLWMAGT